MAKVSLIIPIYNSSKYLKKCINSLVNQTLKDIEIILINDGSEDESDKIIKEYKDKRIKYIRKQNEGIGKTRNRGIKEAVGEYIAFVDSDDYLNEHFCEHMYNKAHQDNCDLVICDFYEDRGNLQEIRFKDFEDSSLRKNPNLINNINLGPCNKLYLLDMLKKNNIYFEENLKYEDAPFVIKTIKNAKKIGKVNEYLTYYVIHENSETTTRDNKIFDILEICKIIINELNEPYYQKQLTNLITMILLDYCSQQRYVKDCKQRKKFINKSFELLDELDKEWRKCNYVKKLSLLPRIIKTNKKLINLYVNIVSIKYVRRKK